MTSVANTVAMTTLAVHTLQPLIFYTTAPTPAPTATTTTVTTRPHYFEDDRVEI